MHDSLRLSEAFMDAYESAFGSLESLQQACTDSEDMPPIELYVYRRSTGYNVVRNVTTSEQVLQSFVERGTGFRQYLRDTVAAAEGLDRSALFIDGFAKWFGYYPPAALYRNFAVSVANTLFLWQR